MPVCPQPHKTPLTPQARGNKPSCLLAEQNHSNLFTLYKPNIGRQSQLESFDSLCRKFHRVGMGTGRGGRQGGPRMLMSLGLCVPIVSHCDPFLLGLLQAGPGLPSVRSPAGHRRGLPDLR